jgi:hypothetical protein
MVESSVAFRREIQNCQRDLQQVKDSVSGARYLIKKERDIGPGQCARIVKSIRSAEEPLRKFSELLDTPELLPLPARSVRHPLLIILDNAKSLLHNLIYDIDALHTISSNSSYQEANMYREHILYQLKAFEQKREAIVQDMDRLLIKANAGR